MMVISGGQTGADRGGLDAAIELGIPHGGWCPKGRRAEDGIIPAKYKLHECEHESYKARTRLNVQDADITVVFCFGPPTGGSLFTLECVKPSGLSWAVFDLDVAKDSWIVRELWAKMRGGSAKIVNVAGSRESKAPGIQQRVCDIMRAVLAPWRTK